MSRRYRCGTRGLCKVLAFEASCGGRHTFSTVSAIRHYVRFWLLKHRAAVDTRSRLYQQSGIDTSHEAIQNLLPDQLADDLSNSYQSSIIIIMVCECYCNNTVCKQRQQYSCCTTCRVYIVYESHLILMDTVYLVHY